VGGIGRGGKKKENVKSKEKRIPIGGGDTFGFRDGGRTSGGKGDPY